MPDVLRILPKEPPRCYREADSNLMVVQTTSGMVHWGYVFDRDHDGHFNDDARFLTQCGRMLRRWCTATYYDDAPDCIRCLNTPLIDEVEADQATDFTDNAENDATPNTTIDDKYESETRGGNDAG